MRCLIRKLIRIMGSLFATEKKRSPFDDIEIKFRKGVLPYCFLSESIILFSIIRDREMRGWGGS